MPEDVPLPSPNLYEQGKALAALSVKPRMQVGSALLSQVPVDTVDIAPDPWSLGPLISEQGVTFRHYSLPRETDIIGNIIVVFNRWRTHGSSDSNGSSTTTNAVPLNRSHPNQSTVPDRSRKRTSNQSTSSRRGGAKRPKVSSDQVLQQKKEEKRLLACPFWKKDPIRHRNCFRGVKRIRDVKQHLRRSHTQPVFCRRCGVEFGDEEAALSEHLRAPELCDMKDFQDPDGITTLHQNALKRHSDRSADEAAQWYVIWDYLFPSGPDGESTSSTRPRSPYVDQQLSEDMSSFREFSYREGWRLLSVDPCLSDVALHIDEDLLQRCLERIYENWLARRNAASQQPWDESSATLSEYSSPEGASTRYAAGIDHQLREDNTMALSDLDFAADLEFESNFLGTQIDDPFDHFMAMPSVDDNTAEVQSTSAQLWAWD